METNNLHQVTIFYPDGGKRIQKMSDPAYKIFSEIRDKENLSNHEAYRKIVSKLIDMKAATYVTKDKTETEVIKVLLAYEEIMKEKKKGPFKANRTWPMINRYGIKGAAERLVCRNDDAQGYKILAKMGLKDLTFESVIAHHPKDFSQEAVKQARIRLNEKKISLEQ